MKNKIFKYKYIYIYIYIYSVSDINIHEILTMS